MVTLFIKGFHSTSEVFYYCTVTVPVIEGCMEQW